MTLVQLCETCGKPHELWKNGLYMSWKDKNDGHSYRSESWKSVAYRVDAELTTTKSIALLVSDALLCTKDLNEEQREVLVLCLRDLAISVYEITEEKEQEWFRKMIAADIRTTVPFNPEIGGS